MNITIKDCLTCLGHLVIDVYCVGKDVVMMLKLLNMFDKIMLKMLHRIHVLFVEKRVKINAVY